MKALVFLLVIFGTAAAFAQDCPPVGQEMNSNGFPVVGPKSGAVIQVFMFGLDDAAKTAITNQLNEWKNASNSSISFSIQPTGPVPIATENNPTFVYQHGDTSACGSGKDACNSWNSTNDTGHVVSSVVNIKDTVTGSTDFFAPLMTHETGHSFGLTDCDNCGAGTVMGLPVIPSSPTAPTPCDKFKMYEFNSNFGELWCPDCVYNLIMNCLQCDIASCQCVAWDPGTPIVVDLSRNGYSLTGANDMVVFDIHGNGTPILTSWTAAGSDDAFLSIDRNGNGIIDDGRELFGSAATLPDGSRSANGWIALAVLDRPDSGGNGDGIVDRRDAAFAELRLWVDANHDGLCQSGELLSVPSAGIDGFRLDYITTSRKDPSGNTLRYGARVLRMDGHDDLAFDVIFTAGRTPSAHRSCASTSSVFGNLGPKILKF